MIKIDIFSGFLGAGKTTLIKKVIKEAYAGEKIVLIENEFGEIGIDGGFLEDAGINITEMNSGCICCSLVGDFSKALTKVAKEYSPERIIIEPSGVGKLSDVVKAVSDAKVENAKINALCAVVDASKCKMYMKNFGEFFNDQVENASCIVLSHTDTTSEEKLATAVSLLREKNPTAGFITAPWHMLDGKTILARMEKEDCLKAELDRLQAEVEHQHEHHHHEHDEECCCGHDHHHEHHHHDHDEECCCGHDHHHEHHHHDHDEDCCCGHDHHHEHHHDHDEECCCGHDHHHHHHADEVFTSWGVETTRKYTKDELSKALSAFEDEKYGKILRAKGIVAGENAW
jgi:G3E family GTPase